MQTCQKTAAGQMSLNLLKQNCWPQQQTFPRLPVFATAAQKAAYYPRFTKEAVYATLATVYLNAGVYTGTEKWKEASDMSDKIISTGAYISRAQFMTNFVGDNDRSREPHFIFCQ
jgi:hypothetical protein